MLAGSGTRMPEHGRIVVVSSGKIGLPGSGASLLSHTLPVGTLSSHRTQFGYSPATIILETINSPSRNGIPNLSGAYALICNSAKAAPNRLSQFLSGSGAKVKSGHLPRELE
jgi:hypothetical protein